MMASVKDVVTLYRVFFLSKIFLHKGILLAEMSKAVSEDACLFCFIQAWF
jgi:hypothetical protein